MLESLSIFATAATAIIMEAAPFLLLGSLIGALLEVFVPPDTLARFIPRSAAGQVLTGVFAGMVLPTCECGIVPVVRRLLLKGVPPRVAIPFMMAAPVINPVVIASTLFAFQGSIEVVFLRCLFVLVPAVGLGLALGNAPAAQVLRHAPAPAAARPASMPGSHAAAAFAAPHPVEHEHACGCGCGHTHGGKFTSVLFHTAAEFVSMARFLVLGAVVASAFKTFLPPEVPGYFADNAYLAIAGLMLLAVLLSICSEADAFVANSFASFPLTSKVAFMAIGPMVDLKLIPLFLMVFHRRVALCLIIVPTVIIYFMAALTAAMGG